MSEDNGTRATAVGGATPARLLALEATRQVREHDAYARNVVAKLIDPARLPEKERAFATLLVYGVVSTRGVLDKIINQNMRRPSDITAEVRDAMRISTYEMTYLDKSSYAAVDQGVELVRSVAPKAAGLANAVLRKVSDDIQGFPWGDVSTDSRSMAFSFGYPHWMVEQLLQQTSRDNVLDLLGATNSPAPVFLATNVFLTSDKDLLAELRDIDPVARLLGVPGCILTDDSAEVVTSALLRESRALVSDAAAQMVAWLASPAAGTDLLEVGSGRGTKTIMLQCDCVRRFNATAHIYSIDDHGFKKDVLARRLADFRVPDVTPVCADAFHLEDADGLPAAFDAIFIDAPCSGTGTLRRHPELIWNNTYEAICAMADQGANLIKAVSSRVKSGGSIIYSTCSVLREENGEVIDNFLRSPEGADFTLMPIAAELPAPFEDCLTPRGFFQSFPRRGGFDGHFAARLVRTSNAS